MSIHKKIKKILSFVLGFAMIVMQTPPCSAEKLYVAAGDVTYIVNEDFDGDDFLWKSSTTEVREFGDSVNPTTYLKTVSGYITLSEELTGNIIIEFMAKGKGSYFSFSTRQNSNYLKTIRSTFRPSFVTEWGYYRVVLDCENLTGKVYSSRSSFTEMVETSQTVIFTDADGFNQITFYECYIDNLRILRQPERGSFCSTVRNGQQDANIENGIEFLFYEPMNSETFTDANIQLANTTDDADEISLENVGMFGFKVVPSYSSIYNRSFECTLSENIENSENSAIDETTLSFNTSMKKLRDSITVESHSLIKGGEELTAFDSESGDISARLVLSNNEDADNTFDVVMALFKNVGDKELFESYSVSSVTLDGEAESVTVDTDSALTVPEHNAGDYSIKIFIWDSLEGKNPLAEQINYNAVTKTETDEADEAATGLTLFSQVDNENGEFTVSGKIVADIESRIGYTVIDNTGNLVYMGQLLNKLGKAQFEQTVVLNTGALSGTYTISAKDTSALIDEDSFDVNTANIKPRAIDVYISGNPVEKDFLKAEYKIHHINTNATDVSEFRWYSATTEEGPYTLIQGANERTYELGEEDVGLYIKCAVIPKLEGIIPGDEEKSLEAVKVSALPTVENLKIVGVLETGEVLTADFETFIGYDGLRIEWLKSDSENGPYVLIDEELSYTYTVRDSDELCYIMFKLYKGEKYLKSSTPVRIINSAAPKEITYVVNEDFEGDDFLWKSPTTEVREFGDSVNPTTYLKAASGYTTLSKELTGNIIIEFMAKGTGSSFSITTRQDSNYLKTITTSFKPSFVKEWGYYRVVLDCENLTGKVYSSQTSFTEMVEMSQTVKFTDADGFNQIIFYDCAIDNLRILNQPVSGSFCSTVKNGQQDANIENGIEFLFYEPMNTETFTDANIQLVNTTDDADEMSLENVGMFGFKVVPSYSSIYNRSFECTLSENIENSENSAIAKTKLSFNTSMKKLTDSITIESHSLIKGGEELTAFDSESGDISARLVLTNNEDADNTFNVVMALFKNVGDKELFESYSVSSVTLDGEAESVTVDTASALTVPEHNAGDYSIKIFIWDSLEGKKPLAEQINYNAVAKIATEETDEEATGLTLSSQVDDENGEFTITGKIATDAESRIGYTVKDPEGKVIYIGQTLNQLVKAQFMQTVILNTGALSGAYTISAKDTFGLENVHNFSVSTANIKPRALDVYINGNPVMGSEIKIQYTIFHPSISGSDTSEFRWYRASEKDGEYTLIPDANEITYTLKSEDAAKYIKCAVIPKLEGVSQMGNEVRSEEVKITARPIATNLSIKGSVKEKQTVTADYSYYDADGKGETSATVVTWYVDGSAVSTGATYTIPSGYAGKKLCFTVMPGADGINGSGDPVTSEEVTISSAGSDGGGGGGGGKQVSISGDIAVQPTPVETVKPMFSDIENHWAKDIIEKLNKDGIINGKGEGKFAPDSPITRAEYVALIVRIAKLTTEDKTEKFSDVSSDSWYFDVVNTAMQHGLVDGFEGAFRPDDSITRQEATVIIYRLCKLIGKKAEGDKSPIQFADGTEIAQWALEGIEFSTRVGIILGDENNNFRPNSNLSRAEAAAILSRI